MVSSDRLPDLNQSALFITRVTLSSIASFFFSEEEHNFNKYSHSDIDLLKIPYDFDSIMHYGRKSFSKNGKDTIRSILNPSHPLGQREGLTDFDIHEINALYDCSSKRNKPFSETATKKSTENDDNDNDTAW